MTKSACGVLQRVVITTMRAYPDCERMVRPLK
jgi:hypothetical protein